MIVPNIDPVLIQIGPLAIRWYSLAYIVGILVGIYYMNFLAKKIKLDLGKKFTDDFLVYSILGILIGGRLGYIAIYDPIIFFAEPLLVLEIWKGGMSFHGGFIGFVLATILFSKINHINYWKILDLASCVAPIGIFLGRLANFINRELIGRVTDKPWGVIFPEMGPETRHASQIYEALSEGLLLFIIMNILFFKFQFFKKEKLLSGTFCVLYSIFRFFSEIFREPDENIGYFFGYFTMGQLISCVMLLMGLVIVKAATKHNQNS